MRGVRRRQRVRRLWAVERWAVERAAAVGGGGKRGGDGRRWEEEVVGGGGRRWRHTWARKSVMHATPSLIVYCVDEWMSAGGGELVRGSRKEVRGRGGPEQRDVWV